MVGKGCSRVLVQQRLHTAPSRAQHASMSASICIWRNTAHLAQRTQAHVLQALRDSEHLQRERKEHVQAQRMCVSVHMCMCMCVYVDVGAGVGSVGTCGMWNIP